MSDLPEEIGSEVPDDSSEKKVRFRETAVNIVDDLDKNMDVQMYEEIRRQREKGEGNLLGQDFEDEEEDEELSDDEALQSLSLIHI